MDNRKTYKIEVTADEIQEIIYSLEFSNNSNDSHIFLHLIKELKELLNNA